MLIILIDLNFSNYENNKKVSTFENLIFFNFEKC